VDTRKLIFAIGYNAINSTMVKRCLEESESVALDFELCTVDFIGKLYAMSELFLPRENPSAH